MESSLAPARQRPFKYELQHFDGRTSADSGFVIGGYKVSCSSTCSATQPYCRNRWWCCGLSFLASWLFFQSSLSPDEGENKVFPGLTSWKITVTSEQKYDHLLALSRTAWEYESGRRSAYFTKCSISAGGSFACKLRVMPSMPYGCSWFHSRLLFRVL